MKFKLNPDAFVGSKNEEKKSYIISGVSLFEIEGSGLEIIKIIEQKNSITYEELMSQINEEFDGVNEDQVKTFIENCVEKQLLIKV